MNHLPEALKLASLGWCVFALGPTGHPYPNCKMCRETCQVASDYDKCDHLICHATYAGTTDPARLEAMWGHFPQSLIGIRTGAASGIIVLDFDLHDSHKNGQETFRKLVRDGTLRRTVSAETGGGGRHMYYQHPGIAVPNDNRGKLGPGADVKGEGGFVVAPPSAKRGKLSYCWVQGLDPWSRSLGTLPDEALYTITKSDNKPINFLPGAVTQSDDRVMTKWESALDQLLTAGVGGRNENLYRAACRGGEVVASGQLTSQEVIDLLESSGQQAGLTPSEIRQTIRSGLSRGHSDFQEEQREV
jgi:hypothetical protein